MPHLVLLPWQSSKHAGAHRPWETCNCEITCVGCEVFGHVGTVAYQKLPTLCNRQRVPPACPWPKAMEASKAGGLLLTAACVYTQQLRQQHAAVHWSRQSLSPSAGQKAGKKHGGRCRGKVTTDIRNGSLSFTELPGRSICFAGPIILPK